MNHTLLKIRHLAAFRHQASMPPNRRIQPGCISKSKANAPIHIVTAPAFSHRNLIDPSVLPANDLDSLRIPSPIGEISHINIALFNILIIHLEDYETDLDAIKTIIHDNQIEVCQANLDIFNQLMKRLNNLETTLAKKSRIDFQVLYTLSSIFSFITMNILIR